MTQVMGGMQIFNAGSSIKWHQMLHDQKKIAMSVCLLLTCTSSTVDKKTFQWVVKMCRLFEKATEYLLLKYGNI